MTLFVNIFTYSFLFVAVFFQVFLLITLFEDTAKKHAFLKLQKDHSLDPNNPFDPARNYPAVTILVPVFNEQATVEKTVYSLLDLEYEKEKLQIIIIDDGSKDNTWDLVQKFKDHPQITLHKKDNGGKYTALNYGIEQCKTDFVGCLDSDSFVDSKALLHIMPYFDNPEYAAVTPSMKIQNPDSILGMIQNAEYNMGIFTRKIFSLLDAQYVTPGPFSIFRKEVFATVGPYRHAHNTEDLEMALRLQNYHYRIANADKAIVYTVGPRTLYKLYKQRVRWTGGFMQNALDYKKMILNPRYGNLGLLILPLAMYAIVASLFFLFYSVFTTSKLIIQSYGNFRLLDWHLPTQFSFEWLIYNLQTPLIIGFVMMCTIVFAIWYGKRLAGVKDKKMMDIVYFLLLYSFISPFWLVTSVYNTIRQRDAAWR